MHWSCPSFTLFDCSPLPILIYTPNSGAGTGAITSQLVLHGYNTTLIEADPEILSAARTFFKLREPAEVHITEASGWLERNAPASAGEDAPPAYKFDIIVHDVVVGGVAPPQLFTMEFWEGVRRVVDDKGVVAVVSASNWHLTIFSQVHIC